MPRYQRTTLRQYYWGIGLACSLILLTIGATSILAGKVGIELKTPEPMKVEILRATSPMLFEAMAIVTIGASLVAVIGTGRGLRKALRTENE